MRSIDTNVLVRLLVRDDKDQAEAAEVFVAAGVWVSHLVLVEAIWVLRAIFRKTHTELAETVRELLLNPQLAIQEPDIVSSALQLYSANPGLGFSDCMVTEIARKSVHQPLGTFDRTLAKKANAHLI